MKNFNIMWVHKKIQFIGGVHKKSTHRGLGQFADLREGGLYYLAIDRLLIITFDVVMS